MKPLHIAFFNRAFYPEVSATGQLLTELAEGLNRHYGCHVSVVAGVPSGTTQGTWFPPKRWCFVHQEQFGKVSVLRAMGTNWSKESSLGRIMNYVTYFGSACLAGLRLQRPDVIIALTDPPIVGLAALLAARRFRSPLVISYRDVFPESIRLLEEFRNPLLDGILCQINRILIHQADRLVALGEKMRDRLITEKEASPEQVVVITDWADRTAIVPSPKRNPFSVEHGLTDRFVVMHSGRLGLSQNLEVLIETARLLTDLPDLVLLFVGDGVKKPALETQVNRLGLTNVRFVPFQPKEDLSRTYATADCFIVSLKPGLAGYMTPSKLYGILAAGRPYVAAVDEECDVARITRQYQCGLLAQPGNPQDLAEKIRQLYRDHSLAQRLGAKAREASRAFDLPKGIKAYYDLCHGLADA